METKETKSWFTALTFVSSTTFAYIWVVLMDVCPKIFDTVYRSAP